MKYCSTCGVQNNATAGFCENCGSKLPVNTSQEDLSPVKPVKNFQEDLNPAKPIQREVEMSNYSQPKNYQATQPAQGYQQQPYNQQPVHGYQQPVQGKYQQGFNPIQQTQIITNQSILKMDINHFKNHLKRRIPLFSSLSSYPVVHSSIPTE